MPSSPDPLPPHCPLRRHPRPRLQPPRHRAPRLTLGSPRPSAPFQCNTPPQITATLSSLAKSGPIFMATDPKSRILKYAYQLSASADDELRWRLGDMVGLRKDTRERALQRRRVVGVGTEAASHTPVSALKKKLEMLPELEQGLRSGDSSMQLEATREFRKPALHRKNSPDPGSDSFWSGTLLCTVSYLGKTAISSRHAGIMST